MSDTQSGSATPRESNPEGNATSTNGTGSGQEPRRPQIGDSRPAPEPPPDSPGNRKRSRGRGGNRKNNQPDDKRSDGGTGKGRSRKRRRGKRRGDGAGSGNQPVEHRTDIDAVELDPEQLEARRGKHRDGKPVGRYLMAVHKTQLATQIAILEGRDLIEHYVARPADDVSQIHGNIYLAKVANVLPGMEAAFVDIGTPKNAVLYRSDVSYDPDDVEGGGRPRIEEVLKAKQTIIGKKVTKE